VTEHRLLAELRQAVGPAHVLTEAGQVEGYVVDWTRRYRGEAVAVVRPGDTAEVAAVVRACRAAAVALVPQGGNTGLVGGSVPRGGASAPPEGQVVLSTRRLDRLEPVDVAAAQVTAGAGVTLEALQGHARAAGLQVGLDLAARGSATVGGIAATNAGGERVLRYGVARAQVVGLEVVLADGTVVRRLSGLVKDNVGYDLAGLVVGSEGTLGVITAARLRLFPDPPSRAAALVGVASVGAAIDVLAALRTRLGGLEVAELMERTGLDLVRAHLALGQPLAGDHPAYLLVEAAGSTDQATALAEALAEVAAGGALDAVVAEGPGERARLWRYRDAHTEAIATLGIPLKLDVAVPLAVLPAFLDEVSELVAARPGVRAIAFGHLAEGNLHVNLLGVADADADQTTGEVLGLVAAHGGSISAEHGLGVAKAPWLALGRSAADVAALRAVKGALDPTATLNPGVIFPEP
jgi:FAD/FMN-containing dehydrogenase